MIGELLSGVWGGIILGILVAGSIVDIAQFGWLLRIWYRKTRKAVYNHVRAEVLADLKRSEDERRT